MTQENKDRMVNGVKMIGLAILAILTIIVCIAAWNANAEPFAKVSSILLLIGNGIAIWRLGKRLTDEYVTALRESTRIKIKEVEKK